VRVVYAGQDGSHAEAACEQLFPGGDDSYAVSTFDAVVAAVESGEAERGVLAIESSVAGPVAETHDLLFDSGLSIERESLLPIRHCLVGHEGASVEQIRVVRSHPMALDQCRALLARMPDAVAVAAPTTAEAARLVAQSHKVEEAAIAGERAAELHGLAIVEHDVGDHPEAFTRFVSVAPFTRIDDAGGEPWHIAFSFVTNHEPGALHLALEPFGRHGIDLVQLVSRPIPQTPWRYRFDAVLAGHPLDPVVAETLREARARTRRLRLFGSYPAVRAVVSNGAERAAS
jgi:prephenate dehydratase